MGTECFRVDCAAVSISLRRNAARKRKERGRPHATLASHSAARGAAAPDAARGGRKGAFAPFAHDAMRHRFFDNRMTDS
ncbi:hypothetical protein CFB84_29105 [Burkholderia aenigmatica]|uniref:Uncharacterized protein n=1 Tax=Burkholderia aenigmatica TaxID=2015348 RepID=A0A228I7K3_9BURK|nr:hypothetical protein CFB84_29105 [Burkholderia aenigmatica]